MERWGVVPKLREGAVLDEEREGLVVKFRLVPVPLLCPYPLPPKPLRPLPEDAPGVGVLEPLPMPPWLLPPFVLA